MLPLKDNIPTRRFPVLTVALIVINVLMFFVFQKAKLTLGGADIDEVNVVRYGAIPYEISHPGTQCVPEGPEEAVCGTEDVVARRFDVAFPSTVLTAFTSMFMHGGFIHIAGNMLFLWIFGNNIEDSMGRLKFIVYYLLGGLVALGAQTLIDPDATAPTIGASGAVAAVLGGYLLLYPRARVVTLVFIIFFVTVIELPALLVLGAWFLLQIYDASLEPVAGGGGVAYFAHIGGFLFGLLLIKLFADRAREDYEAVHRSPVY